MTCCKCQDKTEWIIPLQDLLFFKCFTKLFALTFAVMSQQSQTSSTQIITNYPYFMAEKSTTRIINPWIYSLAYYFTHMSVEHNLIINHQRDKIINLRFLKIGKFHRALRGPVGRPVPTSFAIVRPWTRKKDGLPPAVRNTGHTGTWKRMDMCDDQWRNRRMTLLWFISTPVDSTR